MGLLGRAFRQLRTDLDEDPYLGYILIGALLLTGFWFWHRIPSFATRDERARLLDPLVAYGRVLDQPSFSALQEGVTWGRAPFGATFYLYGLLLLPLVVVTALLGGIGNLGALGLPDGRFGDYAAWQTVPELFWTISLLLVRLSNVAFAVGCVYLTYRLGTELWNRQSGRLAAILLSLTFGFLTIAHEGGEDMPALFFVLLTLYLAARFVESGNSRQFLLGSVTGGVALAFKLTAAPVVVILCLALLLRARRVEEWKTVLLNPRLVLGGAALGAVTIIAGFPSVLVAGPDPLIERVVYQSVVRTNKFSGPHAPVWWWFLRGYFSALSLPLFVAAVGGVLASIGTLARRRDTFAGTVLVLGGLLAYIALFAGWHDFRVHHLLPTFPLLMLLLASTMTRLRASRPAIARPLLAVLLITSGTYAVAGDVGYAFMPRDAATDWLETHAEDDATMEVYRQDMQDAAIPYGMDVRHNFWENGVCPAYIQLTYRDRLEFMDGPRHSNDPAKTEFLAGLLYGSHNYSVVASFGPQPGYGAPDRPTPGSLLDIIPLGISPQTDQYSDEQELAVNQYTTIYRHTGGCDSSRQPPF